MFWLVASAALSTAPTPSDWARPASAQATATVRIVAGARLRFGEPSALATGATLRKAMVRTVEGPVQARLYEFE